MFNPRTSDVPVERNLREISDKIRLLDSRILDGRILSIDVYGKSTVTVRHGLGRATQGFIAINTTYPFIEASTSRPDIELKLTIGSDLQAVAPPYKLKLWVF